MVNENETRKRVTVITGARQDELINYHFDFRRALTIQFHKTP